MPQSAAQKKAASERMKKINAEKKAAQVQETVVNEPTNGVSQEEYQDLLRRFDELAARLDLPPAPYQPSAQATPQVNNRGQLIGTFEKYIIDPANYPDPRERLGKESRLARFAFDLNYDLNFKVETQQYDTKDGVSVREPKFTIELNRIVLDEDTGEPTNKRYTVARMIFHEDPQAALVVARDAGVDVNSMDQSTFLNEMRYLRMRDWLLEAFYPPKAVPNGNKKEVVIGNRLVEIYEVSSENPSKIPFDSLDKKF